MDTFPLPVTRLASRRMHVRCVGLSLYPAVMLTIAHGCATLTGVPLPVRLFLALCMLVMAAAAFALVTSEHEWEEARRTFHRRAWLADRIG